MGKIVVILVATLALLWLAVRFVGADRMSGTAFSVPHVGPLSWTLLAGACIGYGVYRIVKGK